MGGTGIGVGITEEEEVVIHKSIIPIITQCPLTIWQFWVTIERK